MDLVWGVLTLASLALGCWARERQRCADAIRARKRTRALVIVDRLQREGRGLPHATRDELETIVEGLEA